MAPKRPPKPEPERVIRRAKAERKTLTPQLEAFAAGDPDAIWRRHEQRGRLDDPRVVALVPGVKNADARAVFEARVRRMRTALARGDDESLAQHLAEAQTLGLWRANSVVSFEALADSVLGIALERAHALAKMGRARFGLSERLTDAEIAVWLRAEAAIVVEGGGGRAWVSNGMLHLEMPIDQAAVAIVAMGRRELPLVGAGKGRLVVDRPKGVPSMRTIEHEEEERKNRPR